MSPKGGSRHFQKKLGALLAKQIWRPARVGGRGTMSRYSAKEKNPCPMKTNHRPPRDIFTAQNHWKTFLGSLALRLVDPNGGFLPSPLPRLFRALRGRLILCGLPRALRF